MSDLQKKVILRMAGLLSVMGFDRSYACGLICRVGAFFLGKCWSMDSACDAFVALHCGFMDEGRFMDGAGYRGTRLYYDSWREDLQ